MHMRDQLHLGYAGPITFGKPQMEPKQLMGPIFWEDQIIFRGPKPLLGTGLGVGTNVFWLCGLTDIRPFTPAHDPSILSLQAHESNRNDYQGMGQKQHFVFPSLSSSPDD